MSFFKVILQVSVNKCQKVHALATVVNYRDLPKRKVLMKVIAPIQLLFINLNVTQ